MMDLNEDNILLVKLSKNRSLNRVKKILAQNYNEQMHQFVFETTRSKCYPGNFIIRTRNKKKNIIHMKDFEVRSVDEYCGRWYSSKIKYVDPNSNYKYSSIIVGDGDNMTDLSEEMKDSGFKFTIVDNCLVIKLTMINDTFNHKNIQEYLKKRCVTSELVNQTYLDNNEGNGYLKVSWFWRD